MRVLALIARYLLGLMFTVFGLNGLLHFLPQPPMPDSPARRFAEVMASTHYLDAVAGVQLACGLLLLMGLYVPLALVALAAVLFNILVFHLTMAPASIGPGIIATLLWLLVAWNVRPAFAGLLQRRTRRISSPR